MKANEYNLIERCIEDGIRRGINRAHKHLNDSEIPSRELLEQRIHESIMLEICEWFDFSDITREDHG